MTVKITLGLPPNTDGARKAQVELYIAETHYGVDSLDMLITSLSKARSWLYDRLNETAKDKAK